MCLRSNFLFKIWASERLERWAPMALWGNFLLKAWASEGVSLGGVAAGALPEASSGWVMAWEVTGCLCRGHQRGAIVRATQMWSSFEKQSE